MLDPVPSLEQVRTAVWNAYYALGTSAPGALLFAENKLPTDAELMNLFRYQDSKDVDLWLTSFTVDAVQGPASSEYYSIFKCKLRYLAVRSNTIDESWAAHGDFNAEAVRTAIEANDSVFAIGGQQPLLGTPKTVTKDGGFVNIDGEKVYQATLEFQVEARRWQ